MKKIITAIITIICTFSLSAQIKYVEGSFKSTNAADVKAEGSDIGRKNMTSSLMNFLDDYDGTGKKCGIIRVKFNYLANEDIEDKWKCSVSSGRHVQDPKYINNGGALEFWIQVDPGKNLELTLTHTGGLGSVKIPGITIESETMYVLELESEETTTASFAFTVDNVSVTLDNKFIGKSPCTAPNVTYGKHYAKYEYEGKTITREIEVSQSKNLFGEDVEFRNKQNVHFKSNEKNARLSIDGIEVGIMPLNVDVFEGPHTIKAFSPNGAYREEAINIGSSTKEYQIDVYLTKYIEFYSYYNNSRVSGANLYIDGMLYGQTPETVELKYGKHKIRMTYLGNDKTGTLTVDNNTANDFMLTIPPHKTRWNPFDLEFREREFGLSVAYVQKWLSVKDNGQSYKFNYLGEESAMSGIQIGVPIQPIFGYGMGLYTGLFYEIYFCKAYSSELYQDIKYQEMNLYMPIHFIFRLPLHKNFSIFVNGGIGMDLGLDMKLKSEGYYDYSLDYGSDEDYTPNRFNVAGEFGGGLQFKALQLNANYSIGLTNNDLFIPGFKTTQNKLSFALSVMF